MKTFTGLEYIKIALANAYGLDKLDFEDRISRVDEWINCDLLEDEEEQNLMIELADESPLFASALQALVDTMNGEATGFLVGFDSCASGVQILSALTGCTSGAEFTGLTSSNRADFYTKVTEVMNEQDGINVSFERSEVKYPIMTYFYGSTEVPKELFGDGTPELKAFYRSLGKVAEGACEAMQHLLNSWQSDAYSHEWTLPDGHTAFIPVKDHKDFRVEVDEMDHATFTHRIYENVPTKTGLSNAANVVHSVDGMVVREVCRRSNYDRNSLLFDLETAKTGRALMAQTPMDYSKFVPLNLLQVKPLNQCSYSELTILIDIIEKCLERQAFPVLTVHDEFKCHPNYMNYLREYYRDIFAQLADSDLLEDILAQIHGVDSYSVGKVDHNLSKAIKQGNYGIC